MGLNGKIKKQLKEHYRDEAVYDPKELLFQKETFMLNCNKVGVIVDYLCYYQGIDKERPCVTAIDLFWHFWHKIMEYVRCGTVVDVVVMCVDCKEGVPKMKAKEQSKRVERTVKYYESKGEPEEKIEPYPDDCEFDTETGKIKCPGEEEDDYIDMRRLALNKNVRAKLWPFFHRLIEERMRSTKVEFVFFFDYDASGPWMFKHTYLDGIQSLHRPDLAHSLGEADPALMWWTKLLQTPDRDIYLLSIDSDLIALYLMYRSRHPQGVSRVWWHSDNDTVFEFSAIYGRFKAKFAMDPILFVFVCVLLGTDFVEKKWTTNYLNEDKVLKALGKWKLDIYAAIKEHGWAYVVEDFLRVLYHSEYVAQTVVKVPLRFEKPMPLSTADDLRVLFPPRANNKGVSYPSVEMIQQTADLVAFNMLYWHHASDGISWKAVAQHMEKEDGGYLYA
jgi:hypothetical protein